MSLAEIFHRIVDHVFLVYLRLIYLFQKDRFKKSADPERFKFCVSGEFQLPALEWDFDLSFEEIHQLSTGKWHALSFPWHWSENNNCWHSAPDTGKEWPQIFFNSIDYRPGNSVGDARVVWEPARLQQLVCMSFVCTTDLQVEKTLMVNLIEAQLHNWICSNPFLRGIHYISAMECALRIIAVCTAIDNLRLELDKNSSVWVDLIRIVESHAYLIEKRMSLFSSKGNHTIAEAVGLLYVGLLFPEFKHAKNWVKIGKQILADEADIQVLPDGGGAEQSFWYLLFVCDLYGLAHKLLVKVGEKNPGIMNAFNRASLFLSSMASTPQQLPDVGDRDDGYALSKFLRISFQKLVENLKVKTFENTGYTLCKPAKDIRLLFNHSALGMPPAYGHGHADALSIMLNLNGEEILLDSGTFSYSVNQKWRKYFRSTAAHSTVTVDNQDQAKYINGFMWRDAYESELVFAYESDSRIQLLAKHNGYEDLNVIHWRGVIIDSENGLAVWDCVTGVGNHDLILRWHISTEFHEEQRRYIANLQKKLVLSIEGDVVLQTQRDNDSEIAGWRATEYGKKLPVLTLLVRQNGTLPKEFYTCLSWGDEEMLQPHNTAKDIDKFKGIIHESKSN